MKIAKTINVDNYGLSGLIWNLNKKVLKIKLKNLTQANEEKSSLTKDVMDSRMR